jgi:hypothetical protein
MASDETALWKPVQPIVIPASVEGAAIADYARQLSPHDRKQIQLAFESQSYEMGTLFLWSKAMAGLRRQLATLGLEFVGEMLERPDISADSSIEHLVTDHEALSLAEELGMFNSTQAMRLRQAMEIVNHFTDLPEDVPADEVMTRIDASQVLLACVQGVLGHDRLEGAVEFARFRRDLEARTFKGDDDDIVTLVSEPYFFRRTTLRVLLSLVKTSQGAQLEHVVANANVIIPEFWSGLLGPERWLVGKAYAEVHSAGNRVATGGLRKALSKVQGFDYVPEDLRSRTFVAAAKRLLEAHFASNNFYNEPKPAKALAKLGTVIPIPAFPTCMSAMLAVRLGNHWGVCWAAQDDVTGLLEQVSDDRWVYYLQDCLPSDSTVLAKLTDTEIIARWVTLCEAHKLSELELNAGDISRLVQASVKGKADQVRSLARKLYNKLRGE